MAQNSWLKADLGSWLRKKLNSPAVAKKNTKNKAGVTGLSLLEMDLIKDEVPVSFDWRGHWRKMILFALVALFLVAQLYLVLFFWERQEIKKKSDALGEEISNLNTEIEQAKKKAGSALQFNAKNRTISPLFFGHVYWNNFFSYLEKNTLSSVYYSGFTGSLSGNYILKAGTTDYRALGAQVRSFTSNEYTAQAKTEGEKIDDSGKSSLGVLFDFNLTVKPSLFTK